MWIALTAAIALSSPQDGWTWTLYQNDGRTVLAHEIPDTSRLRATLECRDGEDSLIVTVYGVQPAAPFANLSAGDANATAQLETLRGQGIRVATALDHPVVTAFAADGQLTVESGGRSEVVSVPRAHLAKLRRLVELCAR